MVGWFLASFVSATLQVLLQKLADLGIYAYESILDGDDLGKLRRTLISVQSLIHDADHTQISDKPWQDLLQDLENVAYEADDLLDENVIKLEGGHENQVNKLFLSLFERTSLFSAPNLNDIQAKLDDMLREINGYCLRKQHVQGRRDTIMNELPTSSLTDESRVFGRGNDKKEVIRMLCEESSKGSNVSVIPIIGMMGVGKTTLAQLVYNEPETPFNLKMWVSVNKDFDVIRLTRSIIEAANCENTNSHLSNLESLHLALKEVVREKKFLLVLDDVWNEKRNEWDHLLKPLMHGLSGSKIIVTTRSLVVSALVGTDGPYHLKCLSDHDCWLLIKKEALGHIDIKIDPKLEAIGMKIARNCKGFPLAAKCVGRQLGSKFNEGAWNAILQRKIWDLPVVQDEVISALRSSYDHLPSHLKRCFAYCSMFPQSYTFEKDKIVRMWMGEGFIVPDKERKMIEDMGSDYFDQLFSTSFFQMEDTKYQMPDPVHDSAQSIFGVKFYRMEADDDSRININMRHLTVVCEKIQTKTFEASYRCKALRTLLLLREYGTILSKVPLSLFLKLGCLRVLDLSSTHIEELTENIGNLKHLRFLDLSNTLLKKLPEAMQELYVLQTLRLKNCSKLLYLPKSTGRLKNLRHLELGGDSQLTFMPSGIGKLTGLQTVGEFIVGPESGQMKELKDMNNIRGSLCIKQLEKVSIPQEALEANLANKKYLDRLELQWTSAADERNDEHVLDRLMTFPHESLKEIILRRYGGRMFPAWVSNPLFTKLTSICLYECENCGLLPPLGQLPKLQSLKIVGMHELIKVDEIFLGDLAGFQSLETLEFCDMPKLKGWVGVRDNDMACLRELTIVECPEMDGLPSLHYLQSLQKLEFENCPKLPSLPEEGLSRSIKSLIITECLLLKERCKANEGEDWMKIEHIPYIEIDYEDARESEAMILEVNQPCLFELGTISSTCATSLGPSLLSQHAPGI